jgi:hypothetical protein
MLVPIRFLGPSIYAVVLSVVGFLTWRHQRLVLSRAVAVSLGCPFLIDNSLLMSSDCQPVETWTHEHASSKKKVSQHVGMAFLNFLLLQF